MRRMDCVDIGGGSARCGACYAQGRVVVHRTGLARAIRHECHMPLVDHQRYFQINPERTYVPVVLFHRSGLHRHY